VKLVVIKDGKVLDRYEFPDDKRVVIGRHEACDVQLESQTGISRRHCEIVEVEGTHVLKDLGSSNGTHVGGKQIKVHALNNDDVFSVVGINIKYSGVQVKQVQVTEPLTLGGFADLTMNVSPKALREVAGGGAPQARAARAKGHLILRDGGDRSVILGKSVFTIGKDDRSDLQIGGLLVPRMVALIIRDTRTFWLLDVSPKGNGVTVNDEPARARELENGDIVKFYKKGTIQFYRGLPRLKAPVIDPSSLVTRKFKKGDLGPK
jgi:pSer/pThr/pTyr-binding forkhead associated (FHA) protein